jgi:hypothetical protein
VIASTAWQEPEWDYSAQNDSRPETDQVDASADEVKLLLRKDPEFFIEFFLGEELTNAVPQLHKDVWHLLTSTALDRILLAIPRDHAKTTLSKLCVVWYFLFTEHRFAIYLSNTNSRAKDACRDIMNYMKSENFREVYGDIKILKESETESLWIFEIYLGSRWKKCILRAAGATQSMRGINVDNQRPDIAVIDDVEDEENTASPILQAKLDRWIFGTFLKALARRRKIIWLGNMLSKTSLLARLSEKPQWNPVVFGALVRNNLTGKLESLWEDRWSFEDLVEDFEEYRSLGLTETWMCEMMNMPGHGQNRFTAEQVYYRPMPPMDDIAAAWICLDPAFGEDQANDDSSITVHVLPREGPPMVVNEITGKMSEAEIFDEMFRLAMYWNAWVWGIEAVAAQKVLITLFKVFATMKGMSNQIEMIPLISGRGQPKISRITSFVSAMEKKEYAVVEGFINFVTQLLDFNIKSDKNRDDLLDSCAYGPQMLERYEGLLIAQFNNKLSSIQTISPKFGSEVTSV